MMMASLPTASPIARERYSGEIVAPAAESFASCARRVAHALGEPRAARGDARVRHLQARFDRAHQRIERLRRAGLNRKVARETAHRIANVERVFADMRDTAAGRRMLQMRNPRHVGFEHDHQVGVVSSAPGSKPKCIGWLDGRHIVRGLCATTGMAQRSARRSSSTAPRRRARPR